MYRVVLIDDKISFATGAPNKVLCLYEEQLNDIVPKITQGQSTNGQLSSLLESTLI